MGLDLDIYGIPENNRFVDLMELDPEVGDHVQFIKAYVERHRTTAVNNAEMLIMDEVQRLWTTEPRLIHHCELDRKWDYLHFLLSRARRNNDYAWTDQSSVDWSDPGTIAVRGEREWHSKATGGQGYPIRLTPSDSVKRISDWLNGETLNGLVAAIELAECANDVTIYKTPSGLQDFINNSADEWRADTIKYVAEYFACMQKFYFQLAKDNQCAIIVVD